jgi:hypothetical protein
MKRDLIIGCYTNYDWSKIKFWANSIDYSGFTGDKAIIIYNSNYNTVKELIKRKFRIFGFNQDSNTGDLYYDRQLIIVVQRFIDLWNFFCKIDLTQYRYIIQSDTKDVIFQTNPSDWLTANMGDAKILASCESLKYKDEPWGNDNLQTSFPTIYDKLKDQPIWNCGVQAGEPNTMRDLWFSIYNLCKGTHIPNPDQAAYNVLLNLEPYKSITKFTMSEDFWAAQLGTTMDPLKMHTFLPNLLEPQPIFDGEYLTTSTGKIFSVIHQYDRVPILKDFFEKKYG